MFQPFSRGNVLKGVHKHLIVHLHSLPRPTGGKHIARRMSAVWEFNKVAGRDLSMCRWFRIQCDESVDTSRTAQLILFVWMVFHDFSMKEELLTLLPLTTTTTTMTRGVGICGEVVFAKKKVLLEKLVSLQWLTVTHDSWCNAKVTQITPNFNITAASFNRRYVQEWWALIT